MTPAPLSVVETDGDVFADELPPGTELLQGQYRITRFLSAGGFGITYLAKNSLDRDIVIKECFPAAFCRRVSTDVQARSRSHQDELNAIVRLFVEEARSLAKLVHPNIVGVHQVFEENSTAYMSLDFIEGRDLLDMVEDKAWQADPAEMVQTLRKLLDAIGFVHAEGMLHRDISPDNVLIQPDGEPILIDFGAAREQASKQSRILSALRVVKDGYSPQEFYISGAEQGPPSDLYALGATIYHVITRELPPDSQTRLGAVAGKGDDPYVSLVGRAKGYDRAFLTSIDKALALMPRDRVQSAQDWLDLLDRKRGRVSRAMSRKLAAAPAAKPRRSPDSRRQTSGVGAFLGTAAVLVIVAGIAAQQFGLIGNGAEQGEEPVTAAASALVPAAEPASASAPVARPQPRPAAVEGASAEPEAPIQIAPTAVVELRTPAAPPARDPVSFEAAPAMPPSIRPGPALANPFARADRVHATPSAPRRSDAGPGPARSLSTVRSTPEPEVNSRQTAEALASADALMPVETARATRFAVTEHTMAALASPSVEAPDRATPMVAASGAGALAEARPVPGSAAAGRATPFKLSGLLGNELLRATDPSLLIAGERTSRPALSAPPPEPLAIPDGTALTVAGLAGPRAVAAGLVGTPQTPTLSAGLLKATTGKTVPGSAEARLALVPAATRSLTGIALPAVALDLAQPLPAAASRADQQIVVGEEVAPDAPTPSAVAQRGGSRSGAPVPDVQTDWSVDLPFSLDSDVPVTSVNGVRIGALDEIMPILRLAAALDDKPEIPVAFGVRDSATGEEQRQVIVLPVVHTTTLGNGMTFETRFEGDAWKTVLVDLPAASGLDLRPGDHLVAHLGSDRMIDGKTTLSDIVTAETARGTTAFTFAVSRDGQMWVSGFKYAAAGEGE